MWVQAGMTVTQLVLLNPQLLSNADGLCAVTAGQTLCQGAQMRNDRPACNVGVGLIWIAYPVEACETDQLICWSHLCITDRRCILGPKKSKRPPRHITRPEPITFGDRRFLWRASSEVPASECQLGASTR